MAGRIRREDVQTVRERARIEQIVGERVSLKSAGVGSMKGLCPFHDERTPSFHVRPQLGVWHCFGCGEGGDVISFVQKADALSFTEAVEYLAAKAGVELHYEDGGRQRGPDPSSRQRALEGHRIAAEFYRSQLASPEAQIARAFLTERGFDSAAAERFGVGYAPKGWDALSRVLAGRGFTQAEMLAAGLVSQGQRGAYDRFRGRLMWPIRDLTGEVVGFGARRLHDDDQGPKYLNTPETPLYRKSQVLYGVDLAKRDIASRRQVVVVEGYTDVMAMHLAGVTTAIATCGTAFGEDHIRIVRRLLGDASDAAAGVLLSSGRVAGGQVVFTFDGDEAGRKAAMRAFAEDQRFYSQTFIAVAPDGMDPCELRMERGDRALVDLVEARTPLFRFAITSALAAVDVDTPEGRVAGLRVAAPVVARIRDHALRAEYARELAGWLGMDEARVAGAVRSSSRSDGAARGRDSSRRSGGRDPEPEPRQTGPVSRGRGVDPVERLERETLEAVLQRPDLVPGEFDQLGGDVFTLPAHRAVHDAIRAAGGVAACENPATWLEEVLHAAPEPVRGAITGLAVAPLPVTAVASPDRPDPIGEYVRGVVGSLEDIGLTRQIADLKARLSRGEATGADTTDVFRALLESEGRRRALRDER